MANKYITRMTSWLWPGVFIIFSACLEPISFQPPPLSEQPLVVSGQFTDNPEANNEIVISRATKFGSKASDVVEGANVTLISAAGEVPYTEVEAGRFRQERLVAIPGQSYQIRITLSNGKEYLSKPQLMPKSQPAGTLYREWGRGYVLQQNGVERQEPVIDLFMDISINKQNLESPLLKWQIIEAYSFPEASCGGLHQPKTCYREFAFRARVFPILNTSMIAENEIKRYQVGRKAMLRREEFEGVHFISVLQQSINQETYDYWNRVNELLDQDGTVFDKPPAAISGNIFNVNDPDEIVFGVFEVSAVTISRIKILPSDYIIETNMNPLCSPFMRFSWGPECCQCLTLEGTNLTRPPYFD
jgi:hypothetical protein